jgi:hypothetical protein
MKRAGVDPLAGDKPIEPLLHLVGRFVRKREGENLLSRDADVRDEVRDPVRDDACLAAPRPGEDQEWAMNVQDGFTLCGVEPLNKATQSPVSFPTSLTGPRSKPVG